MSYLESTKIIEPADKTIGIRMYGVSLNLYCDYPELVEYLHCLLPGLCGPSCESPDLEVTARWITEPWQRGASLFSDSPQLNGLGKRMQIAEDELVWFNTHRDKDLQLRFRRNHKAPVFDVAYCYQPSEKKLAKYPNYKYKKFFDLLRYLVYFPIAWHLERTRGWVFMHASAVAEGDRAVLIAGPGGAGKTTTCLALVAKAGMTLITENLLFYDGACIHPVVEPIRLTGDSMVLLENDLKELKPIELPGGLKDKSMFWLQQDQRLRAAAPALLFIPQFSNSSFVCPIPPGVACEWLGAINRLTLELNDYYWYTAALDLWWPESGNAQRQLETLKRLTSSTPCYSLGIDRSAGVEPVVDQITKYLRRSRKAAKGDFDMMRIPAPIEMRNDGALPIRCFTNQELLPDEPAQRQLQKLAAIPGLEQYVVVLPDVHYKPRNPAPTGTVILSHEILVPRAIDGGINCGMRVMTTSLAARDLAPPLLDELFTHLIEAIPFKMRSEPLLNEEQCEQVLLHGQTKLVEFLELPPEEITRVENNGRMLPHLAPASIREGLTPQALHSAIRKGNRSLGTIGGGNHFLELQEIVEILDLTAAQRLGLKQGNAVFMLHCDSRRLGKKILQPLLEEAEQVCRTGDTAEEFWTISLATELGQRYLCGLAAASHAGYANRAAVTHILRQTLQKVFGSSASALSLLYDCGHETIQWEKHNGDWYWVHRHGASHALPASELTHDPVLAELGQPVPLPGSMGADSYLAVAQLGAAQTFYSVAHGAGRVIEKDQAAEQFDAGQVAGDLEKQGICLYRYGIDNIAGQAPASFKNARQVIEVMAAFNLIRPVARLRPIAVLKG